MDSVIFHGASAETSTEHESARLMERAGRGKLRRARGGEVVREPFDAHAHRARSNVHLVRARDTPGAPATRTFAAWLLFLTAATIL